MFLEIDSLRIGGRDNDLIISDFEDTGISYESSNVQIPQRAGLYLGRNNQSERTLTFTINTGPRPRSLAEAQDLADELTSVWAKSASKEPGELTEMVIETRPDRRRRIMGRCGKITALNPDVRAKQGSVQILAEFLWSDPIAYAETDTEYSISVLPESQGGIKSPIIAPIQTVTWSGVGYRFVENTGDTPARMAVRFIGPATNPSIEVDGQEVAIRKTLAYDETITVDGRTGTINDQNGSNMSRFLTARTRLDALTLSPGSHEVSFTAEDVTNTARAELLFASAYRNI